MPVEQEGRIFFDLETIYSWQGGPDTVAVWEGTGWDNVRIGEILTLSSREGQTSCLFSHFVCKGISGSYEVTRSLVLPAVKYNHSDQQEGSLYEGSKEGH